MRRCAVLFSLALLMGALSGPLPARAAAPPAPPPGCAPVAPFPDTATYRYFAQTKHSLGNGFKAFWDAHGGLAVFGYPLTEEYDTFTDTGRYTVQYFEREWFEYHPEFKGTPYEVELGLLGVQAATGPYSIFAPEPDRSAGLPPNYDRYFPETKHEVGDFLAYWNAQGGVTIFGYPISAEFEEPDATLPTGQFRVAQWFERAKIEQVRYRTGSFDPTLALLGSQVSPCRGS